MEELSTLDIVDKIYCKCKYPRKAIMDMYLMMLETLEEEFIKGNSVKFPGICTFTIKEYHKKGLSPQALGRGKYSGELIFVDTRRQHLKIKETKAMRNKLNKESKE